MSARRPSGVITLLTDFGRRDPYAGILKGAILSVHPSARIVDLSHDVEPGNAAEAGFFLWCAYRHFPPGTVHAAVVDPGVGSSRRILCARTRRGYFLAPDNGLLSRVLDEEEDHDVREVSNEGFFGPQKSSTFHGRDIFAPVAAHLARRDVFAKLGARVKPRVRLPPARPVRKGGRTVGEVLFVDRFGNVITNLTPGDVGPFDGLGLRIRRRTARAAVRCYAEGAGRGLVFLVGSAGLIEIAASGGSAARLTGARPGDPVAAVRGDRAPF